MHSPAAALCSLLLLRCSAASSAPPASSAEQRQRGGGEEERSTQPQLNIGMEHIKVTHSHTAHSLHALARRFGSHGGGIGAAAGDCSAHVCFSSSISPAAAAPSIAELKGKLSCSVLVARGVTASRCVAPAVASSPSFRQQNSRRRHCSPLSRFHSRL